MRQEQKSNKGKLIRFSWVSILMLSVLFTSCYTAKLKPNEYLLDKNHIKTNSKEIKTEELYNILKQKPNKKILGLMKFHLVLYNLFDSAKVQDRKEKKLARKNKKIKRQNKRKAKKGKELKPLLTIDEISSFGEKILYEIGEAPVILDSVAIRKSANQLHLYLIKKGFFENKVRDSITYIDKRLFKKQRAEVYYFIEAKDPYRINKFSYQSKDTALLELVNTIFKESLIKKGDIFDVGNLEKERNRISEFLLNKGYYRFNKSYINFLVDSSVNGKLVSIVLDIGLAKKRVQNITDSVINMPHKIYHIKKIKLNYIQNPDTTSPKLNFSTNNVDYYIQGKKDVRIRTFRRAINMGKGDIYSKEKEQQLFRNFSAFGLFRVNIKTEIIDSANDNHLMITITLNENKKMEVRLDYNLTTSGGSNFGMEASTFFNHKNIFKGVELFRIGFNGKLEYQPLIVGEEGSDNTNSPINIKSFSNISTAFNTIEFGPEVSITIPKLFFIPTKIYTNVSHAKTKLSASINYQRRINVNILDYERGTQEFIYSYSWIVRDKISHTVEPISFSAIEVIKSPQFEDRINSINDKLLAASFQNHIISATRYRFTYNELLEKRKKKKTWYYSGMFESAGNLLRSGYQLSNKEPDEMGSYSIFGIRFAQYIKTSQDIRFYHELNDKSTLVYRFHGGIGVPLKNLNQALPFEKSFFSGGADKIRAWKARTLGPGSFRDSALIFDKIGEIMLEGNLEYRFDLLGFLDGAFFIDAGNIWRINNDSLRPGSQFKANKFLSEIAIGIGFGVRVDLSFFLLRFDLGFPVKNPSLIPGERWIFQPKTENETYLNTLSNPERAPYLYAPQFNLGIGFPF